MRSASYIYGLLALLAVLFVILIGRAYDSMVNQQLRCLPNDPNACVITP